MAPGERAVSHRDNGEEEAGFSFLARYYFSALVPQI